MKLEKTKAEIDVYGEKVILSLPSVEAWERYQKRMKDGKVSEFKAAIDFIIEAGMSKNIANQLELPHIREVIEFLSGVKKK